LKYFQNEAMEDNTKLIESLLERVVDYGKTTFELEKLKALDKSSDIASSLLPHSAVFLLIASFLLCINLGLALWLGEILGRTFYGFFVVGAFYGIIAIVLHFFMHKWFKKIIRNYIIKQALK
jgi:hypothetical protein